MASSVLLLRLEGPMQAWGVRARWDIRDTGLEPTKSGVIGLIGCAMGLSRKDPFLERLDRELLFGVRVENPGQISTDFHTITGYHRTAAGGYKHQGGSSFNLATAINSPENTIISQRDYLYDSKFLIALGGKDTLLYSIEQALRNPRWPLYLGRKSCPPTRPVFEIRTTEYKDVEDALLRFPWNASTFTRAENDSWDIGSTVTLSAWIECADGTSERQDAYRVHPLRYYGFRHCRHFLVELPPHAGGTQ